MAKKIVLSKVKKMLLDRSKRDQKAADRGSFERSKKLTGIKKLEDTYDNLKPSAKREERMKGTGSKYYEVFKKRGMKSMKEGGSLKNMDKKSPDFTQGLDKKFSAKVAEQNKKALKGNQKKLDANNDGKITGADFEILRKNPDAKKKYGGKITYRMTGGQVVDSTYD